MLKRAQDLDVENKIQWIEGSFLDFNLNRKFSLVLCTSHGFQHILEEQDQKVFFRKVFDHVDKGGFLVFDTRNLKGKNYGTHSEMEFKGYVNNEKGEKISTYLSSHYDKKKEIDWVKIKRVNEKSKEESFSEFLLKYIERNKLNKLLEECGFEIQNQYGDFDKNVFSENSPEIITVCRKK